MVLILTAYHVSLDTPSPHAIEESSACILEASLVPSELFPAD